MEVPVIGCGAFAVFIDEVLESFFGVLAYPVADDVEVGIAIEAEVGFERFARDSLTESCMPQFPPRAAM